MSHRTIIAAYLYPLFQVCLLAIGWSVSWALAQNSEELLSFAVHCAFAALLLSIPLAREAAKLFLTRRELEALSDRDDY
jgi:hypothetical protein